MNTHSLRLAATILAAIACLTCLAAVAKLPAGAVQAKSDELRWSEGPRSLPRGTRMVVLEGDPRTRGIFTMRLEVPDGAVIAPHWHPRAERVTVLEGKVGVGFGKRVDKNKVRYFKAGDFYINPPKSEHFVIFARDSTVQITAEGPWEIHYLEQQRR